ncbi:MAG: FkbM family methyltransferase [Rhodanobacteraceae bacterium]
MTFISYAQNYEDVMLFRALRDVEHGFYIDVGAQDPVVDSVTKAFYERGWRGINIEPAQHWHQKLQEDRPRDINLRVAASDHRGTLHFFDIADTGLSTTDKNFAAQHAAAGRRVDEYDVECRTLDEICAENAVEQIHFLKIDAEGAEAAVLRGMPLDRIRPWIIVVEATLPNSQIPAWQEWQPYLDAHGYLCIYEDGLNRFYLSPEHSGLKEVFRFPPNVFDDFSQQRTVAALDHLQQEIALRDGAARKLREALALQTAEFERQAEELRLQASEIVRLRLETDRMHGEIVSAGLALDRQREEIRTRDQVITSATEALRAMRASMSWRITAPLRWVSVKTRRVRLPVRRAAFILLRPPARMARPLLRKLARVAWLRASANVVLGRNSRIAAHARLFLFGSRPADGPPRSMEEGQLSRSSRRVLGEIHSMRGKAPRKSR